jgi:hypothetical protein
MRRSGHARDPCLRVPSRETMEDCGLSGRSYLSDTRVAVRDLYQDAGGVFKRRM